MYNITLHYISVDIKYCEFRAVGLGGWQVGVVNEKVALS